MTVIDPATCPHYHRGWSPLRSKIHCQQCLTSWTPLENAAYSVQKHVDSDNPSSYRPSKENLSMLLAAVSELVLLREIVKDFLAFLPDIKIERDRNSGLMSRRCGCCDGVSDARTSIELPVPPIDHDPSCVLVGAVKAAMEADAKSALT